MPKLSDDAELERIKRLHYEVCEAVRTSLANAQQIGAFLQARKASLGYGHWQVWFAANVADCFSAQTARRYMLLHRQREQLKTLNVSDLSTAYAALRRRPKPRPLPDEGGLAVYAPDNSAEDDDDDEDGEAALEFFPAVPASTDKKRPIALEFTRPQKAKFEKLHRDLSDACTDDPTQEGVVLRAMQFALANLEAFHEFA